MLRATPLAQRQAHAQRLELSPVTFEGYVLRRDGDATVLACGQMVHDQDLVGLYDVFTTPAMRGQGWASQLCRHLLGLAQARGARVAYLQVESDNDAARSVYRGLGFVDAYAYHYRARGVDPANPSPAGVGAQ
jgi:ribosomal protein S18 acetylase RimI-like enzyme